MGSEFADRSEWSDVRGPDWSLLDDAAHAGVSRLVCDLNAAYRATSALWAGDDTPDGFRWITADDAAGSTYSFLRFDPRDDGGTVACVANFSATPHESYRIGLPTPGIWVEIVNTDAESYGGSGVGNLGSVRAFPVPWHGLSASATLRVPPLGTVWLRHTPQSTP
jgi:1,4-alpha-glucan branching enzyme